MPASKQELYNGEVIIEFLDDYFHTYRLEGTKNRLTSVTSITGQLDKSAPLMFWAVNLSRDFLLEFLRDGVAYEKSQLEPVIVEASKQHTIKKETAATIGDIVHDFALAYSKGEAKIKDAPQEALNGINGFLDFVKSRDTKFKEAERIIYSREYEYVGRTDVLAELDGRLTIIDYKTANGIYLEMLLQLCLYWFAYEEENGIVLDEGMIVRFDKETGEFHEHTISRDLYNVTIPAALSLVNVKKTVSYPQIKNFLSK